MQMPSAGEIAVLVVIAVLLFGGSRVTDIAKQLGSGIREFKNSLKGSGEDKGKGRKGKKRH